MKTFDHVEVTDEQKIKILAIKEMAYKLLDEYEKAVPSQERSEASRLMAIARTNLEQSVMFAEKAVTRI